MVRTIDSHGLNVKLSCELLEVSESSYYELKSRKQSVSQQRREALSEKISEIYHKTKGIYGAPKIHSDLLDSGIQVGLKTVQKLMKAQRLHSIVMKKFKPAHSPSDGSMRENLVPTEPTTKNQVWSTDITYIWTKVHGWCYLSTIMDRYTKKILAWRFGRRMKTDLVLDTLALAIAQEGLPEDLILHSDQGSQYTSLEYEDRLSALKIRHSFSRKGYPYHNAALESWHGHLKREWVYQHNYATFEEAKLDLFWYIEAFYNKKRKHQALGYLSPEQFEKLAA